MKYILINDQAVLTNIDALGEAILVPQNSALCIETLSDTSAKLHLRGVRDFDDADEITIIHDDSSAAATHLAFRTIVDEFVRVFNSDVKTGVAVLFDKANNIAGMPSMTLSGSLVQES